MNLISIYVSILEVKQQYFTANNSRVHLTVLVGIILGDEYNFLTMSDFLLIQRESRNKEMKLKTFSILFKCIL